MKLFFGKKREVLLLLAAAMLVLAQQPGYAQTSADVRYVAPDPATGTSQAAVVDDDVPLVHTAQLLPLEADGALVGASDADQQIDRVLENLHLTLEAAGTGFDRLVKVHVYATENGVVEQVKERFAQAFSGDAKPAVSFVVTALPHPQALVAMDAVAVAAPEETLRRPVTHRVEGIHGAEGRGHAATLPAGETVYVSGQAASGDDLLEATRGTMQSLHATLAYLGRSAEDVVQVKAFVDSMAAAPEVEAVIAEHYREKPAPPIVSVEWVDGFRRVEIELVAAGGREAASGDALSYVTPPGMSAAATFSRVAQVHHGDRVYVSGLYGDPSEGAEGQVRSLFEQLGRVLEKTGSDFEHLAKATYYYTTDAASQQLNEIRPEFYNPERPPAASKVQVRGVGRAGRNVTMDMIAVAPK